jgi:hypothetical protein
MSISRTAFTRIHRDALPTSEKKNERTKGEKCAHCFCPSVRVEARTSNAFLLTHREETRKVGERARLVARSLQRVQREEDRQGGHTERGEKGRGGRRLPGCLPFSFPSLSPTRFPLFALRICPAFAFIPFLHNST